MNFKSTILSLFSAVVAFSAVAEDYPLNYIPLKTTGTRHYRYTSGVSMLGSADGEQSITINQRDNMVLYHDHTSKCFTARPGETVTFIIATSSDWIHNYVYIDYDNDGQFNTNLDAIGRPAAGGELVSYSYLNGKNSLGIQTSDNSQSLPSFKIPTTTQPGVYRIRFKVDWDNSDPGGSTTYNNTIYENGGIIADAILLIHDTSTVTMSMSSSKGSVVDANGNALPRRIAQGTPYGIKAIPNDGYVFDNLSVTYGFVNDTPVHGNTTSFTTTVPYTEFINGEGRIPGYVLVGSRVVATANFVPDDGQHLGRFEGRGYHLVWNDEFNGVDGSHPDFDNKWTFSPREGATWNRFNSDRLDLYEIHNGAVSLKAVRDGDGMVTGAMQTSDKFYFTYGIVEARLKVNPHTGNFPAFWMMPQVYEYDWPYCGEIDIFEQINTENKSYHTIHAYWSMPTYVGLSSNHDHSVATYHVYTLEWDHDHMYWYVDDELVNTFNRSTYTSREYNYPFDNPFYIIINQAVGNGSWAANYDPNFEYSTQFDYVRVYQKAGQFNSSVDQIVSDARVESEIGVTTGYGCLEISTVKPTDVTIADLSGRVVKRLVVDGFATVDLPSGFYIVNRVKAIVR